MKDTKERLRVKAIEQRESFPGELGPWNDDIAESVLRFRPYLLSKSVILYSAIGKEVSTERIRDHAWHASKKVFYPRWRAGNCLELIEVSASSELRPGKFGILEPVGQVTMTAEALEHAVLFVPGLAFDLQGNRLGRGLGCYDRLLESVSENTVTVGLAYEFQIVPEVPVDDWDQKVQNIVTENRVIQCSGTAPSADRAV
jgi:5-formyltetrahydrofolate cyclo-ligase